MNFSIRKAVFATIIAAPALALFPALALAVTNNTVVTVTPSDLDQNGPTPAVVAADGLNKWFLYNDSNDTVDNTLGTFVTGPDTPPYGIGSVEFTLGSTPNDRKNIATYQFRGTSLGTISQLAYGEYSHSGVAGANEAPFFNFNIDFTGVSTSFQGRLVFVPNANGTVTQDTWQSWDMLNSGNAKWTWSRYYSNGNKWPDGNTSEYRTWNDIITTWPNARIQPFDSWLGIRVGEPGPTGYVGNADFFTIATSSGATTFNFDPATVRVIIDKFIDGVPASTTAASASFGMHSTWNAVNIGSGSGNFSLSSSGFNSNNAYEAITANMSLGADYSVNETEDGQIVGTCSSGAQYMLAGYKVGDTFTDALAAAATTTSPSFTNLQGDKYVLVLNQTCPVIQPNTGSLEVVKLSLPGDGTFDFTGNKGIASFSITTSNYIGTKLISNLKPGNYTIKESSQKGWSQLYNSCDSVKVQANQTSTCFVVNVQKHNGKGDKDNDHDDGFFGGLFQGFPFNH